MCVCSMGSGRCIVGESLVVHHWQARKWPRHACMTALGHSCAHPEPSLHLMQNTATHFPLPSRFPRPIQRGAGRFSPLSLRCAGARGTTAAVTVALAGPQVAPATGAPAAAAAAVTLSERTARAHGPIRRSRGRRECLSRRSRRSMASARSRQLSQAWVRGPIAIPSSRTAPDHPNTPLSGRGVQNGGPQRPRSERSPLQALAPAPHSPSLLEGRACPLQRRPPSE